MLLSSCYQAVSNISNNVNNFQSSSYRKTSMKCLLSIVSQLQCNDRAQVQIKNISNDFALNGSKRLKSTTWFVNYPSRAITPTPEASIAQQIGGRFHTLCWSYIVTVLRLRFHIHCAATLGRCVCSTPANIPLLSPALFPRVEQLFHEKIKMFTCHESKRLF